MYSEDDLLPLSGLQHMTFCSRRWALVHIEKVWEENRFTAEGKVLHEKAHSSELETRPGVCIRRTVPLRSFRLGLSGQADVVEFLPAKPHESGIVLPAKRGLWRPYPIEYKRSKDKAGSLANRVQLCAQALCLEEMLDLQIPEGAVYDGGTKRRQSVLFEASLRQTVATVAAEMHALFDRGLTPLPVFKKACASCSLIDRCFPQTIEQRRPVAAYYRRFLTREDEN